MPRTMLERLRRLLPVLKLILSVVLIVAIGLHFHRLLKSENVGETLAAADVPMLVLSGLLYLAALATSAAFWMGLLRTLGEPLPYPAGTRAYYFSHLGKYVPGKGLALVMRTTMAAGAGCNAGMAVLTAVYETLTTMASGALTAAVLLLVIGEHEGDTIWKALALLVLAGVPILPGVFNIVVDRLARKFVKDRKDELPRLSRRPLLLGLLLTGLGWVFLGASLEALIVSVSDVEESPGLLRSTAFVAVSYVAGFVASTPGGLGVREYLLQEMLSPFLGGQAVVVALLLRLVWTAAEVVAAAVVWWFPSRASIP